MFDCFLNTPLMTMTVYVYCILVAVCCFGDYRYCAISFKQIKQPSQPTSQVNQPGQPRVVPNPTHGVAEFSYGESLFDRSWLKIRLTALSLVKLSKKQFVIIVVIIAYIETYLGRVYNTLHIFQ